MTYILGSIGGYAPDEVFTLVDDLDDTKFVEFEVGGLTTGTTRTYDCPDADGTLLLGSAAAFTLGSVLFAGTSGVVTEDNANFFWDDINNRLGIGTLTPQDKLAVAGGLVVGTTYAPTNTAPTNGALIEGRVIVGGTTDPGVGFREAIGSVPISLYSVAGQVGWGSAGDWDAYMLMGSYSGLNNINTIDRDFHIFGTNTTAGLFLDESSGNWGIGTITPTAKLHVDQSSTTAAVPVLTLDQADISEEMISFETTIGTGNAIEAIAAKALTTTHFIKVTIPGGLTRYIPCGTIA